MDHEKTAQALQKPGIGRIVHVVGDELRKGKHIAAIITEVGAEVLEATAFVPGTVAIPTTVSIANYGDQPGQWHWPERV